MNTDEYERLDRCLSRLEGRMRELLRVAEEMTGTSFAAENRKDFRVIDGGKQSED